jgi:hypothetical protein
VHRNILTSIALRDGNSSGITLPALVADTQPAELAHRFVADRARERYRILGALARHSYRQEERWMTHAFWLKRRAVAESMDATAPVLPEIRQASVLEHDEIVLRDVLVLPQHPRGVWRVHDVPVVDLMAQVRAGNTPEEAAVALRVSPQQTVLAMRWLREHRIPNLHV